MLRRRLKPVAIERSWLELGIRIHIRRLRAEQPRGCIVMIPGLGVSGRYMLPAASRLADQFDIVVIDLPGTGRSGHLDEILSVEAAAKTVLQVLDSLGIARATLIANSLGCQVAIELAATAPDRVGALVLSGVPFPPDARTATKQLKTFVRTALHEPFGLWVTAGFDYLVAGPIRIWRTLKAVLSYPIEERASHVRAPVLLVRGHWDFASTPEWNEQLSQMLRAERFEIVQGAHGLTFDAPDAFAERVTRFLSR